MACTFVKRQYPLTINNLHYRIDLVFYHRILRCFVLIDLKRGAVKHKDIGQMNMYLGYFAKEENVELSARLCRLLPTGRKNGLQIVTQIFLNFPDCLYLKKYYEFLQSY